MFSIVLNLVGTLLHFYVAQRLHRLLRARERERERVRVRAGAWWTGAVLVWLAYLLGIHLGKSDVDWRWWPEQFALNWLGLLLTMSLCLLPADLVTGFGFWWRERAPRLLGLAALAGVALSAFAVWQGVRAPAIVEQEMNSSRNCGVQPYAKADTRTPWKRWSRAERRPVGWG